MEEETKELKGFDAKAVADAILADGGNVVGEMKKLKGAKIGEIIKAVPDIVAAVEKLARKSKDMANGAQKKAVAVELANRYIDIPLMPEAVEAVLLGFAIDAVVAAFNKYGKDWLAKISV